MQVEQGRQRLDGGLGLACRLSAGRHLAGHAGIGFGTALPQCAPGGPGGGQLAQPAQSLRPLYQRPRRLGRNGMGLVQQPRCVRLVATGLGFQRQLAVVVRDAVGERAGAAFLQQRGHLGGGAPIARAFGQTQQRESGFGLERRALQRAEGLFGAVEQAGLHEILGQPMLGAFAVGGGQVGTLQQVLVHPYCTLELAAAAKQVA